MRGLPQKQNARRAYKIRLCGHLRRYKKIVKKTYIIFDNPFKEICMGMVIEHIRASIMRHPRHFSMIYYNPVLDSQVMASGIFSKRIILSDECLLYTI